MGKWWLPRAWLYRPIMRLAHRFNWHWMPPSHPDGDTMLWCHWCGIRIVTAKRGVLGKTIQRAPLQFEESSDSARRTTEMKALEVGSVTLVGVYDERPSQHGNCFTVKCDDGKWYQIVNFNHENLEALQGMGLTWPIECEALSERVAVIMDGRIGERWYQDSYCEVCTPRDLLPITQLQRHARDISRGRRQENHGCVMIRMDRDYAEFN